MKAKVHRMVVLIVDHERMSDDAVKRVIENTRYAYPNVLAHESREVDWDDSHPLNHRGTQEAEVLRLFGPLS